MDRKFGMSLVLSGLLGSFLFGASDSPTEEKKDPEPIYKLEFEKETTTREETKENLGKYESFTKGNGSTSPTEMQKDTDFKWDNKTGDFIMKGNSGISTSSNPATITFKSSAEDPKPDKPEDKPSTLSTTDKVPRGALVLQNFTFKTRDDVNATSVANPFKITSPSYLTIKNSTSDATKRGYAEFVLGGAGDTSSGEGEKGIVNILSGSNLTIEGFLTTKLQGTINISSGAYNYNKDAKEEKDKFERTTDGQTASLSIKNDSLDASLIISANINLDSNDGEKDGEQEKANKEASFSAELKKGSITTSGLLTIGDRTKANLEAETITIGGGIVINPQSPDKITKGTSCTPAPSTTPNSNHECVLDTDRKRMENLTIKATKKLELKSNLIIGKDAIGNTIEKVDPKTGTKVDNITNIATDVGAMVKITIDGTNNKFVTAKSDASDPKPDPKPEPDRVSRFVQSSGSILIGQNSSLDITTINQKTIMDIETKDKNAITLGDIVIQHQNTKLSGKPNATTATTDKPSTTQMLTIITKVVDVTASIPSPAPSSAENAGKILATGGISLDRNSGAYLEAFDGISMSSSSSITINRDAIIVTKVGNPNTISNSGSIALNAGGMEIDSKTFINDGNITITESKNIPKIGSDGTSSAPDAENELNNKINHGFIMTDNSNDQTITNQGTITLDYYGILSNKENYNGATSSTSNILTINSQSSKRGTIKVKGDNNTIESSGELTINSQSIDLEDKGIYEGGKDVVKKGTLTLKSGDSNKITLGDSNGASTYNRDMVIMSGGKVILDTKTTEIYSLKLANATLDMGGNGTAGTPTPTKTITNKRLLELGGNATISTTNEAKSFVNESGAVINASSSGNIIGFTGSEANNFELDNKGAINATSTGSLKINGKLNNEGTIGVIGDKYGLGTIYVNGDVIMNMTKTSLFTISSSDYYSITFGKKFRVLQVEGKTGDKENEIKFKKDSTTTSSTDTEYKTKQDDFIKNKVAIGDLGEFLESSVEMTKNTIDFSVNKKKELLDIKPALGSSTAMIDKYLEVLSRKYDPAQADKVNALKSTLQSQNSKSLVLLNNILESANGLELGFLRDLGRLDSDALNRLTDNVDRAMKSMSTTNDANTANSQELQNVRDISVQNRMTKNSNPFVAQYRISKMIEEIAKYKYASSDEIASDTQPNILSGYDPRVDQNRNLWASLIVANSSSDLGDSTLQGLSVGYDKLINDNILIGAYASYAYSSSNRDFLKNNGNHLSASLYARIYYRSAEIDLMIGQSMGLNNGSIIANMDALKQSYSYTTYSTDVGAKYGVVFNMDGYFLKPQVGINFFGTQTPELSGNGANAIQGSAQTSYSLIASVGAEARKYISAFSYVYVLPQLEQDLNQNNITSTQKFVGATNSIEYSNKSTLNTYVSVYAGGEGYINEQFSVNIGTGVRAGLVRKNQNISLNAGFKYKF